MAQEDQILIDRQQAYKGFIKFATIGTLTVVVALALMGLTLL
jgi:putative flippase GtrA